MSFCFPIFLEMFFSSMLVPRARVGGLRPPLKWFPGWIFGCCLYGLRVGFFFFSLPLPIPCFYSSPGSLEMFLVFSFKNFAHSALAACFPFRVPSSPALRRQYLCTVLRFFLFAIPPGSSKKGFIPSHMALFSATTSSPPFSRGSG